MLRRSFVLSALGVGFASAAHAQTAFSMADIRPSNQLETSFLAAFENEDARPAFRQELLRAPVALAMANAEPDSAPREVVLAGDLRACALFTSVDRLAGVLGPAAARIVVPGREALTRVRGKNAVLNYRLLPMLTLEPADIEALLALPA